MSIYGRCSNNGSFLPLWHLYLTKNIVIFCVQENLGAILLTRPSKNLQDKEVSSALTEL